MYVMSEELDQQGQCDRTAAYARIQKYAVLCRPKLGTIETQWARCRSYDLLAAARAYESNGMCMIRRLEPIV